MLLYLCLFYWSITFTIANSPHTFIAIQLIELDSPAIIMYLDIVDSFFEGGIVNDRTGDKCLNSSTERENKY